MNHRDRYEVRRAIAKGIKKAERKRQEDTRRAVAEALRQHELSKAGPAGDSRMAASEVTWGTCGCFLGLVLLLAGAGYLAYRWLF
ncbi:hypothetical protein [Kitasatospora sp. DSM 101779]|uniref:hypothetical protein n=1 Tax=Kitasatospora sp. DSM 101779 TaxID=2853165 RepID=UPI0021DA46DE|nr:hypothetical protein [Kitasatospora sp. DSM 101779]MCU7821244.1 hypothetical protein [Kitasatospora sp. DSM 101779]